jgi:transposase-like protein
MDLNTLNKKFDTDLKCLAYLEQLRWGLKKHCPNCNSENIRFDATEKRNVCNNCLKKFSVANGTMFEHSHYPLTDWFKVITLILNAKTGISAMNIMRNMDCSYKTAWYLAMRVRCAMIDQDIRLQNLIEMDEAFFGGKPRKANKNTGDSEPTISTITNKRGRGTKKTPVVGIVERNGEIVLQVTEKLTSQNLLALLKGHVNTENSIVMTDEYKGYKKFDDLVQHLTINHSEKQFSKGIVNLNTIEGFWSIVKNSMRGQYIAISKKYLPFYLVQAQYIYNRRNATNDVFEEFLKSAMQIDKSDFLNYYKPVKEVPKLVYKQKKTNAKK